MKLLRRQKYCRFLVEPIQGEGGVVVPDDGYLINQRSYAKNTMFYS